MRRGVFIVILLVAAGCCGTIVFGGPTNDFVCVDCGVKAVYTLLRLKGLEADLLEISRNLERVPEKGCSIYNLETYLHARGIQTDARMMRRSVVAKKSGRLAILLLDANAAGHYVIARTLSRGRLQLIDSLTGVAVIDEKAFKSSEQLPVVLIDP